MNIDVNTGELMTDEELADLVEARTIERSDIGRRYTEDTVVKVEGNAHAISSLAANIATSKDALAKIHKETRERAYRKMRK